MTFTETTDYFECGGISLVVAFLPLLGLFVSEVLPYIHKSDSCNGITQTLICGIKHLINKEPCSAEDLNIIIQNFTPNSSPRVNAVNAGRTPPNSPV